MRAGRRQAPLAERVQALDEAAELSEGRGTPEVVDRALQVVRRADRRLRFSGDHTVVALAGATGSGKSSSFNAISHTTLAEPGVRRPTTSKAMAAVWGEEPASDLLDWLDVPRRHQVSGADPALDGLVLLDLPDHDSTEAAHRQEVDRLVQLVDMFIWVVDPQKYADAALHDRYLRPLAAHADVMTVVLNQVDRLTPEQEQRCLADLRRLLDSEGLQQARLTSMSALTGQGVEDLRGELARAVRSKQAAASRLGGDVQQAAVALSDDLGNQETPDIGDARVRALSGALARAAGVDTVSEAVLQATRRRGTLATGWPALSWIARLRPDPLRRLHLAQAAVRGRPRKQVAPVDVQRTALPSSTTGVQKARVDAAVRELADGACEGLPRGWSNAVRRASRAHEDALPDRLDRAVATADLGMDTGFGHWRILQVLQWILITAVLAGLLWLAADVVLAYFRMPALPALWHWHRIGLPTLAVGAGVLLGLLLAGVGRAMVEVTARRKATRARGELTAAVAAVVRAEVIDPVNEELDRHRRARQAVARAR